MSDNTPSFLAQLKVRRETMINDLVVGLIMAIIALPIGLGGGALAGVNPVHGLYSLIVGTSVAAVFTGSVAMSVDATTATALATRDALVGIPADQQITALVTLVILVGLFQVAFGLLRLGSMVRFISNAVMTGFLSGIATLTILGQIGNLTGYDSAYSNRVVRLGDTLLHFEQIDIPTLAVGVGTIAMIVAFNRTRWQRYAYPLALLLATLAVPLLNLDSVALIGQTVEIPRALPRLEMPALALVPHVLLPALAIAITALVQASGVSQSYPNPDGRYADHSRDFLGQGIGNIATGFFAGLPVGGSLSGTALTTNLGAQSRWANIFTGLFVALSLLLLGPVIGRLPETALSGMLVMVGIGMVNVPRIRLAWQTGRTTTAIMLITFCSTLLMPIQYAVFVGVALHVVVHVYRAAERTRIIQLAVLPDGGLAELPLPPQLKDRGITILEPVGSLFFAGAAEVENLLPEIGDARNPVVILRLRVYDEMGSTFLRVMERYRTQLAANNGRLMLAGVNPHIMAQLEKTGIAEHIGRDNIFPAHPRFGEALYTAVAQAQAWLESPDSIAQETS